ncbi:MAG: type II toxin-antitoxin system YoeB family toxin [Treponemataceae bacterium]|nr:type II toxin-antitoxin system YoeB family toxin [Treponemataceae bacterium]
MKHELTGYYSRRIDSANRLVYKVDGDKLNIIQCGTHYHQEK